MSRRDRLTREKRTVRLMIGMYCRARHGTGSGTCADCQELLRYAEAKIDRCPFQDAKTVCANCRVHCYKPDMRERIRTVMRFSGPRMLLRHPGLALLHGFDSLRRRPGPRRQER